MARHAQRRQAKAVHRKRLLAERRGLGAAEAKGTLAQQVRRASAARLHSCLVQSAMFECGAGMVIVIRKTGPRGLAMAGFLVDVYCLGVKDAFFREMEEAELETLLDGMEETAPLETVDPSYARKLLRDAVAYARTLGLEPPADYAAVEPLFGDIDPDACDVQFQFGYQGKPFYVPGPSESPTQIRRRLDLLRRRLGDDGFEFEEIEDASDALEELDYEDEDEDDASAYDPAVAPDPARWLALDEQERVDLAIEYHQRDGVTLPSDSIHAAMHVIVENQIALGDETPARRAVERLMGEGLDRHEAVHAIGSVLAGKLFGAMSDPEARAFPLNEYNAAVEQLTAESWRLDWANKDKNA
jgi:Domain of unknown function (DUF1841)